jgi:hypothetical protein
VNYDVVGYAEDAPSNSAGVDELPAGVDAYVAFDSDVNGEGRAVTFLDMVRPGLDMDPDTQVTVGDHAGNRCRAKVLYVNSARWVILQLDWGTFTAAGLGSGDDPTAAAPETAGDDVARADATGVAGRCAAGNG